MTKFTIFSLWFTIQLVNPAVSTIRPSTADSRALGRFIPSISRTNNNIPIIWYFCVYYYYNIRYFSRILHYIGGLVYISIYHLLPRITPFTFTQAYLQKCHFTPTKNLFNDKPRFYPLFTFILHKTTISPVPFLKKQLLPYPSLTKP